MFHGIHVNPENNADEDTPEKGSNLFLTEMTQDVIQWDEGNNMDLDQKYRSPQPPGSGSKSENGSQSMSMTRTNGYGSKSNTPLSTTTNNSSLFAGVKRQFDHPKNRSKARKRHEKGPNTQNCNFIPTRKCTVNQNKANSGIARDDDFAHLLNAITTPKSGQVPRTPLSPMDQNNDSTSTLVEKQIEATVVGESSAKNCSSMKQAPRPRPSTVTENGRSLPQINYAEIPAETAIEVGRSNRSSAPKTLESNCSEENLGNCPNHLDSANQNGDEDEFGGFEFSEDDLAKIDSLTQPMPLHNTTKESLGHKNKVKTDNNGVISTKESASTTEQINHPACIQESSDEFGDFPSDIDFSQLDAMASTEPSTANEEQSSQRVKSSIQPEGARSRETHDSYIDLPKSSFNNNDRRVNIMEKANDDEDEFGSFPQDVDFSKMDAVVDSERFRSKTVEAKASEDTDEFGDFPDDIDFNVLDQVVTEKVAQARVIENPSSDPVRNKRTNRKDYGGTSFMNFSRYKVLSIDVDERNCTKTLRVANWTNAMADSDEVITKILKDGKVKALECHVHREDQNCLFAHATKDTDYPEAGLLYLCGGDWYATPVRPGDVIHVCSLTGQYRTDDAALPIVLNSCPPPGSHLDDLVLVLHPEMLMSPSIISETATCNRRAALKSKMGSSGISSKSALIGTLRHGIFEACMKAAEFDSLFAQREIKKLVREKAEMLISCNITENEAEAQILGALPMIQQFAKEYTTLRKDIMMLSSLGKDVGGMGCYPDIRLLVKGVHSVEESIVSTSLGLKGSIDAVLNAESTTLGHKYSRTPASDSIPRQSLMCLELKTGHNQKVQSVHMAQLSLYTFMLQSRYGAHIESDGKLDGGSYSAQNSAVLRGGAPGGILLYLNDKSQQIMHISPQMNEAKTLMSQRNVVASDSKRTLRPRGISLCFEEDQKEKETYLTANLLKAPTAILPEVIASSNACERCYSNRECMLYAASDEKSDLKNHRDLISRFVGHLNEDDIEYFRKWDRLIDIEAESSRSSSSTPWLSKARVRNDGIKESISGMIFDSHSSYSVGTSDAMVCFRRKKETRAQSSPESLNITSGSDVIISADGNPFDSSIKSPHEEKQPQNRMYISKGRIDRVEDDRIFVSMTLDESNQIKLLSSRYEDRTPQDSEAHSSSISLLFRLDKITTSFGTGTLRWNLINFLTGDHIAKTKEETSHLDLSARLNWLRDVVIRLKIPEFEEGPQPTLFHGPDNLYRGCDLQELSEEFYSLNDAQQMAVKKVMSSRDYTLIQGLPGTGKTSTLGFLTRLLVAQGRRVLITAYTHSAVDNIMIKLMEKGMGPDPESRLSALVRLASRRPCHESLKSIMHTELAFQLDKVSNIESSHSDAVHPSAASLVEVIERCRVLGVSALSLPRSPLLQTQQFDVVIIDEAGQMNEPTALGALAAAEQFILVGDHKQLPPLVNSSIAEKGGYGTSILKRLADEHPHAVAPLTMQYRMNEAICQISSEAIYGGQMRCGNEKVRSQLLNLPGFPSLLPPPCSEGSISWLHSVIDPERPVVFVDTDKIIEKGHSGRHKEAFVALEGKLGGSIVNKTEAKLVWHVLNGMKHCGHDLSTIGVISPFRAQIKVIEDNNAVVSWKINGLELSTIDKYQGRDKSTIIVSLVRSNEKGNAGRLLQDARRLNVAFTRAKCKLIVIGSYRTLRNGSAPLKPILNRMNLRNQRIELPHNALDCYKMELQEV